MRKKDFLISGFIGLLLVLCSSAVCAHLPYYLNLNGKGIDINDAAAHVISAVNTLNGLLSAGVRGEVEVGAYAYQVDLAIGNLNIALANLNSEVENAYDSYTTEQKAIIEEGYLAIDEELKDLKIVAEEASMLETAAELAETETTFYKFIDNVIRSAS